MKVGSGGWRRQRRFDPDPDGTGEGVAADGQGSVYGALTAKQALKKYARAK